MVPATGGTLSPSAGRGFSGPPEMILLQPLFILALSGLLQSGPLCAGVQGALGQSEGGEGWCGAESWGRGASHFFSPRAMGELSCLVPSEHSMLVEGKSLG